MAVLAIVLVFGVREKSGLAVRGAPKLTMKNLVHTDDLLRLWNGQKLQRNAIEHRENTRVHSDPERDCQDGDHREPGILRQRPRAVAEVMNDLFKPGPAPGVAGLFLEECGITECTHGGVAGFSVAHAASDVLRDLLFQMKLNFVV